MFEALLRERMDAEQAADFDEQLEEASFSVIEAAPDLDLAEKSALMAAWGGAVVTD